MESYNASCIRRRTECDGYLGGSWSFNPLYKRVVILKNKRIRRMERMGYG